VAWRSVVINNPAKLKREQFALVVEQGGQTARVPFEDIATIVLHHREITLTHPVLAACADYGIALYSTGDNHQPNGVMLPFLPHSRGTRVMRLQQQLDKPTTKRAWAHIVQAKIRNQLACLQLAQAMQTIQPILPTVLERLESLARRVKSGDSENLEAQASAAYFPALFAHRHTAPLGFTRHLSCWSNNALDYGYAVLRGAIARALVAHGFMPSLGLFHSSEQNAFNLADDVIEPYRAIVDCHVAQAFVPDVYGELSPKDKAALVGLLNVDVAMPRGKMTVLSAIEHSVESLLRMVDGGNETLLEWPVLLPLRQHRVE
jgi:CRISPR-associated protein Cas1